MKINRFLVIVCLLLCLTCLVACSRDPDGTIITTGRKPFAAPDPNNPYDEKVEGFHYDEFNPDSYSHQVAILHFTNTESLNNLFHDFVPEDFPGYDIKSIRNTLGGDSNESTSLRGARDQLRLGDAYTGNGFPNLERYCRAITIEFNFDDLQKMKDATYSLSLRPEVRGVYPGDKSFQWFEEPNDPKYQTNQQNFADLIDLEEAWDHTTGSSSVKIGVLDSGILDSVQNIISKPLLVTDVHSANKGKRQIGGIL